MNRCQTVLPSVCLGVVLALSSAAWLPPATAQQTVRQFPQAAKRGMLLVTAPPEVLINGSPARLAPGVRIRDPNNMLVMSQALVGQSVTVNYVREPQGLVRDIWILNQTEEQEKRLGMEPTTNFVFGSAGDKPKSDDGKTPFDQLPKFPKQ